MKSKAVTTIVKNSTILTGVALTSRLSYYLYFVLVARYLGPSELGKLTLCIVVSTAITKLVNLGVDVQLRKCASQEIQKSQLHIESAQSIRLVGSFLGILVFIGLWATLGHRSAAPLGLVAIVFIRQVIESFRELYVAAIQAHQRMEYQAYVVIPTELGLVFSGYLYLSMLNGGLYGIAFLLLGFSVVRIGGLVFIIRKKLVRFSLGLHRREAIEFFRQGLPLGVAVFFSFLMARGDIFLIAHFIDEDHVGYYQASYNLMDAVVILLGTIRASIFPTLAYSYKEDRGMFFDLYRMGNSLFVSVLVAIGLSFMTCAGMIVGSVYGEHYHPSVAILRIFSVSVVFAGMSSFSGNVLVAMGRQKALMYITMFSFFCNVCLNVILIPSYGIKGSAGANAMTWGFAFLSMWYVTRKERRKGERVPEEKVLGFEGMTERS